MRVAIVLFNLGGPDRPEAVQPFLFNLFNDPAIIGAPTPVRWLLAKIISRKRAPVAQKIYAEIGGRSPLLELSEAQSKALDERFATSDDIVRSVVCMRYWHPMSKAVAKAVAAFKPDRVVLLPLYPQYSVTTSGSSMTDWYLAATAAGIAAETLEICCYPDDPGLIAAQVSLIRPHLEKAAVHGKPRVLFSAHGLPKKVIDAGDPYQWQIERTSAAVAAALGQPDLDWVVSYQSKVGPLEWIGPSTDNEIARAGADGVPLVVVPIAFVSEHAETLVELDIEYRHLAAEKGVPAYERVPAPGTHPAFIDGLADLVRGVLSRGKHTDSGAGGRICPASWQRCRCRPVA
ncbi:MAG: ferrochelatase [Proteobacteria bacterium]|nr:ferrochelatase [Pseudomonadota bacterium]